MCAHSCSASTVAQLNSLCSAPMSNCLEATKILSTFDKNLEKKRNMYLSVGITTLTMACDRVWI